MAYKDSNAERTTITRSIKELESSTGNVYQTISVLSKRSNQINIEMKEELNQKLDEFATSTDNLEEIFENREQIEVSRYYEKTSEVWSYCYPRIRTGKNILEIS